MTIPTNRPDQKQMPILARHAVSLSIAFVMSMVLSYFAGQYINQQIQLNKLTHTDQARFEQGLAYVLTHARSSETVTNEAVDAIPNLAPKRASDLLLAVAQSHAIHSAAEKTVVPANLYDIASAVMQRSDWQQAIGLYDGLVRINGVDAGQAAKSLLAALNPNTDAQLLQVIDLLDTRLLWSKQWAPPSLWVRWLSVLAQSNDELTQFNTAKRLGELPEAVDDDNVLAALSRLATSEHETVRAAVLRVCAGYAAIATDPTDYEQLIFAFGRDANKHIARRAWMIVGHLNPLSGFAVNWKEADPFVAEAMLWAAVKTNQENPKPAIDAWNHGMQAEAAFALIQATPKSSAFRSKSGKVLLNSLVTPPTNQRDLLRYWRSLPVLHDDWAAVVYGETPQKIFPTLFKTLDDVSIRKGSYRHVIEAAVYYSRIGFHPLTWEDDDAALTAAWIEGLHRGPLETLNAIPTVYYQAASELLTPTGVELSRIEVDAERFNKGTKQLTSLLAAAGSDDPRPQFVISNPLDKYGNDPQSLGLWIAIHAEGMRHLEFEDSQMPHLKTTERVLRGNEEDRRAAAALYFGMINHRPTLIDGFSLDFPRRYPNLDIETIRVMSDAELSDLGLSRVDALSALLDAAEAAPPSANRIAEAKLLKLALWMRGDLGDEFTPIAEAMLFDKDVPTSTVLMCLLHMQRPAALDYLFGDLASPRPDLHKLFIQERYWHVFRRFVDTSDLPLWLWGDPEAQAFQLEAMQQWYAVNQWKIEQGWWPKPK